MNRKNPHWGTTLDEFLAEDGIREAGKAETIQAMKAARRGEVVTVRKPEDLLARLNADD